ncbi:MAG: hypothetical protein HOI23_13805 [Deltaproteobacteria bacterium]|nr:hypothetical protein [Deltaproteobacteria bacterium]MBT6432612.1 hypothetical protein [Deltaproteobacteria bacterium]
MRLGLAPDGVVSPRPNPALRVEATGLVPLPNWSRAGCIPVGFEVGFIVEEVLAARGAAVPFSGIIVDCDVSAGRTMFKTFFIEN